MKKLFGSFLFLSLIFGLAFLSPQLTGASSFTEEDLQKIRENQLNMGASEETVNRLIEKLLNGEAVDADIMNPEDAVSSNTEIIGDFEVTTYVFPDGSRSQLSKQTLESMNNNPGGVQTLGISGGSCSTDSFGTSCTNRKISYQLSTYGYSFYANYYISRYGYDSISWAGNWNIWVAGGNYSNPSMRIIRKNETSSQKAEARLSATINAGGDIGSLTRSLSLHVGKDSATYTWNTYY